MTRTGPSRVLTWHSVQLHEYRLAADERAASAVARDARLANALLLARCALLHAVETRTLDTLPCSALA